MVGEEFAKHRDAARHDRQIGSEGLEGDEAESLLDGGVGENVGGPEPLREREVIDRADLDDVLAQCQPQAWQQGESLEAVGLVVLERMAAEDDEHDPAPAGPKQADSLE